MKTLSDLLLALIGLLSIGSILVILRQRVRGIRVSGPVLMLRKFKVDGAAPDGVFIEIEGRGTGLIGWLMTLVGLEPRTAMSVTATEVHFQQTTLLGQTHLVLPLSHISLTYGGFAKPVIPLVIGIFFGVSNVLAAPVMLIGDNRPFQTALIGLLFGLVVCGICGFLYWTRRRFEIVVGTSATSAFGFAYQRSIIENEPVELEKTLEAVGLLHRKVIESRPASDGE